MAKALRCFVILSFFFLSFVNLAFSQKTPVAPAALYLAFEPNRGQTAPQVMYLTRSREGTVFLTKNGVSLAVPGAGNFSMRFEGAVFGGSIPEQRLASHSNYLDGNRQISGIENYGAVLYRGVYPRTDVRFYGRAQHLEHDFLLAPGADPNAIVLRLDGIDHLRINDNGTADFTLGTLHLGESAPVAWQIINGKHVPVQVKWRLAGKNRMAFTVGAYDRTHELTIDPVLAYSTHLGGATEQIQTDTGIITGQGRTSAEAVAVDSAGNIYVAGSTSAVDFPLTAGSYDHTIKFPFSGGHDPNISSGMGFISKFDPTGQTLIYSTYLGSAGLNLAVDGGGHAYTLSDNSGDLAGGQGIVINKLNTDGSALLYSFVFGQEPANGTCAGAAGGNASSSGIAVDDIGNVWIAGTSPSQCLPTTVGAFQTAAPNKFQSGFVAKLDTTKTGPGSIVYATYLGGSFSDALSALAVDSSGNAYLTGLASSADFPQSVVLGTNTSPTTFVSKLSADGSRLLFSTFLRGGVANKIAVDTASNVYLSGVTVSTSFPTTANALRTKPTGLCDSNGASNGIAGPCDDAFVAKLNPSGETLIYSTLLGGSGVEFMQGLSVNSTGSAFVTGFTSSPDFPLTPDAFGRTLSPANTSYLTELAPDGGSISYSTLLSGWSFSLTLDGSGNPYIVGVTSDWAYVVTPNAFQPSLKGFNDGFLAKIDMVGSSVLDTVPPVVALNSPGGGSMITGNLTVSGTANDNVAVMGTRFTLANKDVAPEITQPPYAATFDSTTFPNGQHTLTFLARDAAGNVGSQSVRVTVSNPIDFSFSVSGGSPSSITVADGGFARYETLVRTISGLPGVVTFSCTGLPAGSKCSFLPATLDMSIDGGSESVFINTTAPSAASLAVAGKRNAILPIRSVWLGVNVAFLAGLLLLPGNLRRRKWSMIPALAVIYMALLILGCGGGGAGASASSVATPTPSPTPTASSVATPPGTYNVTVVASATGATRTLNLQLVVK